MENITEKLIEYVKKYNILYDLCHPDYKNNRAKNKIWDEIGDVMKINGNNQNFEFSGDEVKKKWKNVRDSYAKYLRSQRTQTGQAAKCSSSYRTWPWAQQMQFFKSFLQFAQTTSNVSILNTSNNTSVTYSEEETEIEEPQNAQLPENPHASQNKELNTELPNTQDDNRNIVLNKRKKKNKHSPVSGVDKVISYLDSANKSRQTKDELDLIFLGYAATVRKLNRERQVTIKYKIAKLLMEEELQQLNETLINSRSSTSLLSSSVDYGSNTTPTNVVVITVFLLGKLKDTGTAEFIAFFDMLFDTLHGDLSEFTLKLNRKPLSALSSHKKIWQKFLIILPTMKVLTIPGELVPGYGCMGKNAETNLVDETEFYEVINTFPKSEVSIDVDKAKKNLLQRINELEMESEKISEDLEENEDNFKNIQLKYYEDSGCEADDFENKTDTEFYVSIDDLNNITADNKFDEIRYEENQESVAGSATNKPINLGEYSKKLYFVLKDSECTDVTSFHDYACTKSSESGNVNIYISDNNEFVDEETILMQDYEECAEFVIRHFGVYLDYSEYFIDETCMYKRTNCIKIVLEEEATQYNGEEYFFTEDDYIDESQIAYSDETIIIGEPLDRYADLRIQPSMVDDKIVTVTLPLKTSAEKGTSTDDLPNDQSQSVNVVSDDYFSHKYFNISTVDTVFDILIYISRRLAADNNYIETITDIVDYINKFIISPESKLKVCNDNFKEQTTAIYDVIVRMLTMLALSKTTADEQKNAYTKAVSIQLQLHTLASKYEKVQEQQNKKEAIYSVPSFFNNHNEKACTKDDEARTKEYDIHINFSKVHKDTERLHSKIEKESKQAKDDSPMEIDSEDEKEVSSKAEVNDDDDNDFEPYVFDAWQISINGAKKLFELLQKKRFTSIDMNSLNIDHLRQIIYNFRADHGINIENNHHIKITFIDPDVVTDVFETDDAIILD
ncbi:madf domain transcription factor [Holotrichia oblita]|uniref:Madf domain transcription factor n=1 Tax=Holotrichia oblita TaxID=644536 RepID=A0ACB9TGF3_HOLOL|nr:madf domain transcription factor [Holotrichia oblita]